VLHLLKGLGLVALGKYRSAAEDLQAYVEVSKEDPRNGELIASITILIDVLNAGRNPFNDDRMSQALRESNKQLEEISDNILEEVVQTIETSGNPLPDDSAQ